MNKQILSNFTEPQLVNYLNTLKKRIADLRAFDIELTNQNIELDLKYKQLYQIKLDLYRNQNKGLGLGRLIGIGKQKIQKMFKKQPTNTYLSPEERQKQEQKLNANNRQNFEQDSNFNKQLNHHQIQDIKDKGQQSPSKKQKKKIGVSNFEFDDLYEIGKNKLHNIIQSGGEKIQNVKHLTQNFVHKYIHRSDNDESKQFEVKAMANQNQQKQIEKKKGQIVQGQNEKVQQRIKDDSEEQNKIRINQGQIEIKHMNHETVKIEMPVKNNQQHQTMVDSTRLKESKVVEKDEQKRIQSLNQQKQRNDDDQFSIKHETNLQIEQTTTESKQQKQTQE